MQAVFLLACGAAAGSLIGAAWRLEYLGWAGIVGIAVFLLVQARQKSLLSALSNALVTGIASFAVACPWLPGTIRFLAEAGQAESYAIAIVYYGLQSLGLILFAAIWRCFWLTKRDAWLLAPPLWVGLEQVVPTLFPWPPAALLTADLPMLQVAELGGVYLASLLVLGVATFLAWSASEVLDHFLIQPIRIRQLGIWLGVLLGLLLIRFWGEYRMVQYEVTQPGETRSELRVGLVQADTGFRDSNQRMVEATRAMAGLIDLAIWPESALGDYCRQLKDFKNSELVTQFSLGDDTRFVPFPNPHCPLLAGADTWDDDQPDGVPDRHFVSALLIDDRETLVGSREKARLMPYGEYIPGEGILPFLRTWLGSERIISPGTSCAPIGRLKDFQIGVLLCCEDMHPDFVRATVVQGANFLVTLGNGMAFDSETALRQHFRIAQLRAIEHRLPFLRCTSTGVSGLIAPSGRVQQELPTMEDVAIVLTVPRMADNLGPTLFTRLGALVPAVLSAAIVLAWALLIRKSSR